MLKWYPIFDSSPLHQFSKFNNFLWVRWFLGNFFFLILVFPDLKLHNRYCHNNRIFGIIPNPLAKIHRDVTKSVDSFFENIPLIGWEKNYYTCYYYFTSLLFSEIQVFLKKKSNYNYLLCPKTHNYHTTYNSTNIICMIYIMYKTILR